MPGAALVLIAAAFTIAVSLAAGRLLLRGLGNKLSAWEEEPAAFVTGAACLSFLVFILAALRIAYASTFAVSGVGILAVAGWKGAWRPSSTSLPPLDRKWRVLFLALFLGFGLFYLLNAMAPETSPDGSAYHLGLVARYHAAHGLVRVDTNLYAMLSQGMEMLFWFAFAFGGHSAAALVHLSFAFALALAMVAYGRRFGMPLAGAAGALFVFLSPLTGMDASVAYNDMAVAATIFVLFHLLSVWRVETNWSILVPVGLLAGFGYALKYTAFPAIPYALGVVLWKLRGQRREAAKAVCIVGFCALLMMLPWLAKNTVMTGNPFAPFLNSLFPSPYIHVSFEQEYRQHMRHYEGLSGWTAIPLEATVRGAVLCGLTGPLFLLAPLALLALRRPEGRRLLLAWAVFAATYFTNVGARFLLPSLPFLAMAMALAMASFPRTLMVVVAAHAILSLPPVVRLYADRYAWRLHSVPWEAALRIEPEQRWLSTHFPEYTVARAIEDKVPPGGAVFSFNQVAEAYTSRRVLVAYQSALGQLLGSVLWTPAIPDYQPLRRVQFAVSAVPHRKLRVVQTAQAAPDNWTIIEARFFNRGKEVQRSPAWRLRASHNIWDVQLAFDNSPVTSWSTWQAAEPYMSFEIDFGSPVTFDSVALDCPGGQHRVRMRIETQNESGQWAYEEGPQVQVARPRPGYLRTWVADEFLSRGVTHLLVRDTDFFADDFRTNATEWRLSVAAELPGSRLYRFLPRL